MLERQFHQARSTTADYTDEISMRTVQEELEVKGCCSQTTAMRNRLKGTARGFSRAWSMVCGAWCQWRDWFSALIFHVQRTRSQTGIGFRMLQVSSTIGPGFKVCVCVCVSARARVRVCNRVSV